MIKCKYCKTPFEPHRPNQKFCCKEHTYIYFQNKLNKKRRKGTAMRKRVEKVKFNKEDYEQNFKDHCVSCGKTIKAIWGHYKVFGNYCGECCATAEKNSKNKPYKLDPKDYIVETLLEIGSECRNT